VAFIAIFLQSYLECNSETGSCTSIGQSPLSWVSGGQHQLSWTPDSSLIDAYKSEEGEVEQLEIRDTSGNLLNAIVIPEFTWTEDVTQPISMSSDTNSIILTYGIDDLLLVDLESGAHQFLLQGTPVSDLQLGKAQFCNCGVE
jgi:hypothetical protein